MSWAVTVMLKAVPAVCGLLIVAKAKWSSVPPLIVTLPDVPVLPVPEVAVNVPVVALPVYFIPNVVRLATPELKFPAWFSRLLAPEPRPETVPVNGALATMVTLSVAALNAVTVLPQVSCAVRVFVPVKATAFVCGLVRLSANCAKLPALTLTVKRSAPAALMVPSVAAIVAVSALYSVITPFEEPETVATPLVNVIVSAVPKLTAVPVLLVTVGFVIGFVEGIAPEKVSDLSPV